MGIASDSKWPTQHLRFKLNYRCRILICQSNSSYSGRPMFFNRNNLWLTFRWGYGTTPPPLPATSQRLRKHAPWAGRVILITFMKMYVTIRSLPNSRLSANFNKGVGTWNEWSPAWRALPFPLKIYNSRKAHIVRYILHKYLYFLV